MTAPSSSHRMARASRALHPIPLLLLAASAALAQSGSGIHDVPPPVVRAAARTGTIVLDGRPDEAAWQAASPATDFRQSLPNEGKPATQRTEVRVLYDADAIYVGARMYDSLGRSGIRTRLARRDQGGDTDLLTVVFDTFHDHLGRARFEINPSGVKGDALGAGGGDPDPSWDPVWEAATSIDSLGWSAELRIPLSQLRFPREPLQTWGMQVVRYSLRLNERTHWAFWTRQESGGPPRFGHLEQLALAARPRGLEVLPYVVARSTHIAPDDPRDPFARDGRQDYRAGADVKYLLTSNLTLDATVNPDFGQVEADPAVVNLSAFETFFPERRPFFIEGAGIFSFGDFSCFFCSNVSSLSLFYSRRVGRAPQGFVSRPHTYEDVPENATILGAAKITGRTARGWSVGVLDAVTRREFATALDTSIAVNGVDTTRTPFRFGQEVEPLSNYFVGRVKRDFREGTIVVGAMGTSVVRRLDDDFLASRLNRHAENAGVDANMSFAKRTYTVLGNLAVSRIAGDSSAILRAQRSSARYYQRPDRQGSGSRGAEFLDQLDSSATSIAGYGGYLRVAKDAGSFLWETAVNVRSPGFEPNDIAFQNRADYFWQNANLFKRFTKPTHWYRELDLITGSQQQFNFDGDLTDRGFHFYVGADLLNNWSTNVFFIRRPGTFEDRLTRGGPTVRRAGSSTWIANIQTDSRRRVVLSTNPSYGRSEEGTVGYSLDVNATYKPVSNVSLTLGPSYSLSASPNQYVRAVIDPTATAFAGRRYVFAELNQKTVAMNTRVNVTFTPRLSFEAFAQPFIASIDHSHFKEFDAPREQKKSEYGVDRGTISVAGSGFARTWTVDPDGGGPAAPFSFSRTDGGSLLQFNTRSLIGNAVLRWEYLPGSTLFLVWSQARDAFDPSGDLALGRDRAALFRANSDDVFLVKVSWWLGL